MFLINLLRRLRGFVGFTAKGPFVERFLNLIARARIPVWDVSRREDTLTGCVSAAAYPRLRPLAKKAGVRLRMAGKHGLPFQRKRLFRRRGIVAGLCLASLFLFGMSRFIWSVQVHGNEAVPQEKILSALETVGIRPGILRSRIQVREAEGRALLELPELSWIALNIDGSTIHVEVYETMPVPPMVDPRSPCNVVAGHAGQILELRVYAGQAMLNKGDAVLEGQVIVSGVTQDRRGQNLFRHARADIIAQVEHEIEVRIPLSQTVYVETGKTARRDYLRCFGIELPLFLPWSIQRPYLVDRAEFPWSVFSLELPILHRVERFTLMEEVPVTYTEEEGRAMAMKELAALQEARLGGAEIISRTLTGGVEEEHFVIRADYICHMNIAVEKEILTAGE